MMMMMMQNNHVMLQKAWNTHHRLYSYIRALQMKQLTDFTLEQYGWMVGLDCF